MPKSRFVCDECGHVQVGWLGRCPSCQNYNTLREEAAPAAKARGSKQRTESVAAMRIVDVPHKDSAARLPTGIDEFDRALGGGITEGSVVLIGGEPGIGKSTLLLQICRKARDGFRVLYVTGEESAAQVKQRALRLGVDAPEAYLLAQTDAAAATDEIRRTKPQLLIVDSIQTMRLPELSGMAGAVTQIRECAAHFGNLSKEMGMAVLLVGHITKDGAIAGPRVLEHMVDAVLYFEGDPKGQYRIIRAQKNRFGSVSEIGVFEMTQHGLLPIKDPSAHMLEGRMADAPGSIVTCAMEGTRPMLMEVQALVSHTAYNNPRRTAIGLDQNRMVMLLAVLEARAGFKAATLDAYVNIAGGIKIAEPAADAAIIAALYGCRRNAAAPANTIIAGEVGLSGELRAISHPDRRLAEAARAGFAHAVLPAANAQGLQIPKGFRVSHAKSISEMLRGLFS